MEWSDYQEAIFDEVADKSDDLPAVDETVREVLSSIYRGSYPTPDHAKGWEGSFPGVREAIRRRDDAWKRLIAERLHERMVGTLGESDNRRSHRHQLAESARKLADALKGPVFDLTLAPKIRQTLRLLVAEIERSG